eukprot:12038912-Alexandrium_andersonii.AAC.1
MQPRGAPEGYERVRAEVGWLTTSHFKASNLLYSTSADEKEVANALAQLGKFAIASLTPAQPWGHPELG